MISVNDSSNTTAGTMCSSIRCTGRTQHDFRGLPAWNAYSEPSHEETPDKSKWEDILQNNWPVFFKTMPRTWETKKDWGTVRDSRMAKTQGKQIREISDWLLHQGMTVMMTTVMTMIMFCSKGLYWDIIGHRRKVCRLDNGIVSVLFSWGWSLYWVMQRITP